MNISLLDFIFFKKKLAISSSFPAEVRCVRLLIIYCHPHHIQVLLSCFFLLTADCSSSGLESMGGKLENPHRHVNKQTEPSCSEATALEPHLCAPTQFWRQILVLLQKCKKNKAKYNITIQYMGGYGPGFCIPRCSCSCAIR